MLSLATGSLKSALGTWRIRSPLRVAPAQVVVRKVAAAPKVAVAKDLEDPDIMTTTAAMAGGDPEVDPDLRDRRKASHASSGARTAGASNSLSFDGC